ncbi:SGNH/GDSL hydrolase family protein [Sphingobacterium spiritivorum]|uniref:SGNH/GDSL hydrolase family protein n=1 Tax=Sphingobacterium spiritivorum TaxID=258 RepID=UPI003DA2A51C
MDQFKRFSENNKVATDTYLEATKVFYPPHFDGTPNIGDADESKIGAIATYKSGTITNLAIYQGGGVWREISGEGIKRYSSGNSYSIDELSIHEIQGSDYIFLNKVEGNVKIPQLDNDKPWKPYEYGGVYVGEYISGESYTTNNVVTQEGYAYYCLEENSTEPKLLTPPYWVKIGSFKGLKSDSISYSNGDVVIDSDNIIYLSQRNNNLFSLSDSNDSGWELINKKTYSYAFWGDSLTKGTGSTGKSNYPDIFSRLTESRVYNGGVPGETSTEVKSRFLSHPELWGLPTVLWVGKNNHTEPEVVKADIADMLSKVNHDNYLVLGLIKATTPDSDTDALNLDLRAIYGDRFVDIQSFLIANYDKEIPQDVDDFNNNITPWSLRSDWLHLNNKGYELVGKLVASRSMILRGSENLRINNVSTNSIQVTGNEMPDVAVKALELLYREDDDFDEAFIQSYDRVLGVPKPLSIGWVNGSKVRLIPNGGSLEIGGIETHTSGEALQLVATRASIEDPYMIKVMAMLTSIKQASTGEILIGLSSKENNISLQTKEASIGEYGRTRLYFGTLDDDTAYFQARNLTENRDVNIYGRSFNFIDSTILFDKLKAKILNNAPATASSAGEKGEIRFTDSYIYVCIDTNTWVRSELVSW